MDEIDDYDQYEDEGPPCPRCDGHRTVNCYCGGDLCICQNYGEKDCPLCHGAGVADPKRAERYLETEREMAALMRKHLDEHKATAQSPGEEPVLTGDTAPAPSKTVA